MDEVNIQVLAYSPLPSSPLLAPSQVMSNDHVMVCNFETAIQTDPTTCLLVVSRSVVAPSNRKGLSPEVISAFARLKYVV